MICVNTVFSDLTLSGSGFQIVVAATENDLDPIPGISFKSGNNVE